MRFVRPLGVLFAIMLAGACARSGKSGRFPGDGALHIEGAFPTLDPTVRNARLLPEVTAETQNYGAEPDGGVRAFTAGLRVVTMKDGRIFAAEDRLSQTPSFTVSLPERLGGGFLFVVGAVVYRADRW